MTNVLAISGSDQSDKKGTYSSKLAFGECVDVLAPADNLWTTDREGTAGYPFTPSNSEDYNFKFSGTSGATPIVAGIAGIVRSINSNYSAQELRRIIRDTTDKIQPSAAEYSEETGKSNPTGGDATHGWGRVNAYEAAKVASDEVDIFVRDNRLDWGNTQQPSGTRFSAPSRKFIPWWQSVDIKVDAPDSNGQYQSQPTASAAFESLTNEDPKSDETNHVYVRLRNRGPKAASNVKVTLYYAFAGTTLPRFSNLTKIGSQTVSTLPYSGPSVAGTAGDPAKIVQLDWKAPQPKIGQPNPNHFCLLAVIESQGDKPDSTSGPVANLVPNDNNITLDNVEVNGLQQTMSYERFYVRNPLEQPIETLLRIEKPQDWEATLDGANFDEPFELDPGEERSYTLTIESTETSGDVEVLQEQVKEGENWIMGGMTYRFDSEHTGD